MESADTHWLISVGLVTSSVIAVTANSFLLLIFCRRRGLRTVSNRFVINLLITNLLSSLLLIPLLIVDHSSLSTLQTNTTNNNSDVQVAIIRGDATLEFDGNDNTTADLRIVETSETFDTSFNSANQILCYASQVGTSFVSTLSILSILLIGINQYFGVIHSLRYHFYINKCRSTVFIISSWLVALLFSVLASVTNSDGCLWRFCRDRPNNPGLLRILNTVYAVTYFIVVILAPFVAICVIYVCIYSAAHRNSERMRKSTSANLDEIKTTLPKVHSAPTFINFADTVPSHVTKVTRTSSERSTNFIITLKHKISNASMFRPREETRAAKISVLVIFLVLFCYVPYGLTLVLNSGLIGVATPQIFNYTTTILLVSSNVISPFLFAYRNKRVKREIGKVLRLTPPDPLPIHNRRRSANDEHCRVPFLDRDFVVPEVIVTCNNERKSILKRVCQSSNWTNCKKCNFIAIPESCISGEARGSFSSASTQTSNDDC